MQQRIVKDFFFAPAIFCPPLCFLYVSYCLLVFLYIPTPYPCQRLIFKNSEVSFRKVNMSYSVGAMVAELEVEG